MAVNATLADDTKVRIATGAGTAVAGLSFTAAAPAHLTGTGLTMAAGDVVSISGSNVAGLDGVWVIGAGATATDVILLGSDLTTATAGALPVGAIVTHYDAAMVTDFSCLIQDLNIQLNEDGSVPVGTFCSPSAAISVPPATVGTVVLPGILDVTDAGFKLLDAAAKARKKVIVTLELKKNGWIVFEGTLGRLTYTIARGDAYKFSVTITLSTDPRHLY